MNLSFLVVEPQHMPNQKQTHHTSGVERRLHITSFFTGKTPIPRPTKNWPQWRPKASFPPILVLFPLVNTLMRLPALAWAGSGGGMPLHTTANKADDGQQAVSGNLPSHKNEYSTIQRNLIFDDSQEH